MNESAFPIISVSEHGGIDLHRTSDTFMQSYAEKIQRRGWYRNMDLLGSNGMKCTVTSATVLGGLGPWFGFILSTIETRPNRAPPCTS